MTITTNQARELRKRITKLVNAEIEYSSKGVTMPDDWPDIEERCRVAKKRVHDYVEELKLPDGRVRP